MREELVKEIRKDIDELKKQYKEEAKKMQRLRELEDSKKVREYLRLRGFDVIENNEYIKDASRKYGIYPSDEEKDFNTSEEYLVKSTYRKYLSKIESKDTNDIYVFTGTYAKVGTKKIPTVIPFKDDNIHECYKTYRNIESSDTIRIPYEESHDFESKHKVIYPVCPIEKYWSIYNEIQSNFFYYTYKSGQKEAVKRLLREYK